MILAFYQKRVIEIEKKNYFIQKIVKKLKKIMNVKIILIDLLE